MFTQEFVPMLGIRAHDDTSVHVAGFNDGTDGRVTEGWSSGLFGARKWRALGSLGLVLYHDWRGSLRRCRILANG